MRAVFLDYETVLIHGAKHLKLIALSATGTDNDDLAAARERGVGVCNVRGYCSRSVMQRVWAMILGLTQRLDEFTRLARARHVNDASTKSPRTSAIFCWAADAAA